ncbi:TetR/AcrR family transcriptional regulator C-terminal domain-containing protein [Shimazuella sp. AN120528]|uniref:TetR/AcrR family transcriptional regulator C-terminal domain-containing protein n=1 Tax=Shimazuella soli TaxID=1892854 RepID=UPI001F1034CD|nr:TetR/AcrR family transcriptional regulator C-terminal domain-containing protein [Shimazuella soli]
MTGNFSNQENSKNIDKDSIVKASLELLNQEGIKKLTMRKVAERLEIKGASLYWHFKNKMELMTYMAEEISKQIPFPDEKLPWEEQLIQLFHQMRSVLLTIRDSAHILVETPPSTPHRLKSIQKFSDIFMKLGFDKEDIFSVSWMLNNYVSAFVIEEYRFIDVKRLKTDSPISNKKENGLPFELSIPNMDKEFQFGLEVLIAGIKSKL